MPFIILSTGGQPEPVWEWHSGQPLLIQTTVKGGWQAGTPLLIRAATAPLWQSGAGLSIRLRTADLPAPVVPPLPPVPAGAVVHAPPIAYLITHGGLPLQAVSYSLGNSRGDGDAKDKPTATVELRGQYGGLGGELFISVTATSLTDGQHYAEVYGPFTGLRPSMALKADGWVTTLSLADTTAADAEREQGWDVLQREYLPWEIERDLTPEQQAEKAREDALKQQALKDVKCQDKAKPDLRSQSVHSVIYWLIERLALPTVITAPLPYARDRFWATEDTGTDWIGTSYKVKGKKAIDALRDILGRVGWTVKLLEGQVIVGPPAPLSSGKAESAGELNLPEALLTETRIELVNATEESGDFTTPRRYDFTGASRRFYKPPIPNDDPSTTPEETFETMKAGTMSWGPLTAYSTREDGTMRLESTTSGKRTKAGGVLVSEEQQKDGIVKVKGWPDADGNQPMVEMWAAPLEKRTTTYGYSDPLYPQAITEQLETVAAFQEVMGFVSDPSEVIRTTQTWHPKGWLQRKDTVKRAIGEWLTWTNADGSTTYTLPAWSTETEHETWYPTRPGWWKHHIIRTTETYVLRRLDDEPEELVKHVKSEVLVNEETDQGPPLAPTSGDDTCPEDKPEGFEYRVPLTGSFNTNGRGDPVSVDIEWATSIPATYFEWVTATNRQRPAKRTTYSAPVPIRARLGSVVKSYSIQGKAGSVQASAVIEEVTEP
ncbi:hypothetical protein D3875_04110 [Deinococcus cavernae]|uniref:Uncharacterized protein n=1 Tax=Deinococcus cavernae TaxID=2320857 RepID=A0A418VEE5_9DEIO|nr:hypothetical protein [Deinococcus cavernae]RJF74471.1 hypothetical protein D3875_04110 [Deinococcus cavernae]